MSSNNIRLEGLDSLFKRLEKLEDKSRIERALGKCCAKVERTAKQKAPKDNGDLRRSITSKVEDLTGVVYTPLEHAPYVEYGTGLFAEEEGRMDVPWCYQDDEGEWHTTSGQPPQPYMRPALNENRQEIIRIITEEITK